MLDDHEVGALTGYEKYLAAVRTWGESSQRDSTYFALAPTHA